MSPVEIDTPHGSARVTLHRATGRARALLLLGHGAGGGVGAPDLVVATDGATARGVHVGLVEQPYRVAGRRAPAPALQLDAAWLAVVAAARAGELGVDKRGRLPLLAGGRSSGARVACRTAAEVGASGVLCLAFPVHPPGKPDKDRMPELDGVEVPVLVVQGRRDPFGCPDPAASRDVVVLDGDHSLKADPDGVRDAVATWLTHLLP
ncbi:MAG: alpha/beta hydrolase [Pseudonocardia sp.]|nr:alpha/beta hydrolase [Pseudonocardia sp.]